jgi:hypothetical protein
MCPPYLSLSLSPFHNLVKAFLKQVLKGLRNKSGGVGGVI